MGRELRTQKRICPERDKIFHH